MTNAFSLRAPLRGEEALGLRHKNSCDPSPTVPAAIPPAGTSRQSAWTPSSSSGRAADEDFHR
jgi:hypothetical protein